MDEIVKQAMAKWPNVPACYGWLGLDARGNWYLRDAQVQAQGPFATSRGSRIEHEKLIDFIGRNYLKDGDGNWFFQNGPQRVFVALETTPWIWRLRFDKGRLHMHSHTGEPLETAQIERALMDEDGCLYLQLPAGLGVVHSQDMLDAASAIEAGILSEPDAVLRDALPAQYGFERDPAPH